MADKTEWPELVSVEADIATNVIQRENPNLKIEILLAGTPTSGEKSDRVRLYVNIHNLVVEVPRVG
ncbi:serine protease inhibitor [Streptomyces sp. NPDC059063]|uniref:serine protease inhibitor n=1 Tax=unclassified Streptomyces TaxID=2593676 RepID=UPI0036B06136